MIQILMNTGVLLLGVTLLFSVMLLAFLPFPLICLLMTTHSKIKVRLVPAVAFLWLLIVVSIITCGPDAFELFNDLADKWWKV